MTSEPTVAERLGFEPDARLLIIHADDAGMCHSANAATRAALETGTVTSAAVMIPCPWMAEMAAFARESPGADLGVHLTLTSEWTHYRWGPVAPLSEVRSLLGDEGYLPRGTRESVERGTLAEVELELRAQISRALAFGFRPTHLDSHMGTLFTPKFFPAYLKVAREFGLLPMLPLPTEPLSEITRALGVTPDWIDGMKREGFVFIDHLNTGVGGDTLEARREGYEAALRALKPGVNEIIVHLAMDDPEIRSITGHWEARWNEFQIFTDPRTRELIDSLGIHLIGYRELAAVASLKPATAA